MRRKHVKVYDGGEKNLDRYTVAIGYGRRQQFIAFWQGGGTNFIGEARDGYKCGEHMGKRLWKLPAELQAELDAYLDDTDYCEDGFTFYTAVLHDCKHPGIF